jgi:hypothetical protein
MAWLSGDTDPMAQLTTNWILFLMASFAAAGVVMKVILPQGRAELLLK